MPATFRIEPQSGFTYTRSGSYRPKGIVTIPEQFAYETFHSAHREVTGGTGILPVVFPALPRGGTRIAFLMADGEWRILSPSLPKHRLDKLLRIESLHIVGRLPHPDELHRDVRRLFNLNHKLAPMNFLPPRR